MPQPRTRRTILSRLVAITVTALVLPWSALAQNAGGTAELVRSQCALCHGERGESTNEQFPQLAGQNARYLRKQIDDFRAGRRSHESMTPVARGLSEAQIDAVSAYFEQQKPVRHAADDALLAGVGRYVYERGNVHARVPACASCHGQGGLGNATLPRLAGQHPQYVENQLRRFHTGERRNDAGPMGFVTGGLTELELRAVAAYVGGL
jgi:cytochrome c553